MNKLQIARSAWINYQNWKNEWEKACASNARLEHCWSLNDYMIRARARWERASFSLSNAEVMQVTGG